MKLIMTMVLRDEADIVGRNLDFHFEQGVDHVVAVDNGSIDGTREILERYRGEGRLTLISELGRGFDQGAWMSRAARVARDDLGADWILHNDADEFWASPVHNLKAELTGTGANILQCQRHNMIFGWDSSRREPWFLRCRYRAANPSRIQDPRNVLTDDMPVPYYYMDLPSKIMTRTKGLTGIADGNHSARFDGTAVTAPSLVTIYHFPIRSTDQFRRKIEAGATAVARNPALSARVGWHWRRWHKMLREKGIGAVLDDALPDRRRLLGDLAAGILTEDRAMLDWLTKAEARDAVAAELRRSGGGPG